MKKIGMEIETNNSAIQGPRGLSIKEVKFKNTLANGDNVYQVILEDNTTIGEITSHKGDKGDKGDKGNTGNGIEGIYKTGEDGHTTTYKFTFTNGDEFNWSIESGDSAYEIAVDNDFEGTEAEWLETLIGKGLEFTWRGTELGVRVEGETEYKYTNLRGKNIEFNWSGTSLGTRIEGETSYQYVNLKGERGPMGELGPLKADDFEVHYMGHYNPSIKYCNGDIYYKGTVISFAIPDTSDPTFTKISNTGDKRFFRVYGGVEKEYTIDNSIKDLVADIINNS